MIFLALEALRNEPELRGMFRKQYKYIMVDEYQDTNGAQLELLFSIIDEANPNVCCVGDDDQAIYRFQGATLSNFKVLNEKIPSLETISLKNNYRSTGDIIELTDNIISHLPGDERISIKKLKSCTDYDQRDIRFLEFSTEEEELKSIIEEIKEISGRIKKDKTLTKEERDRPFNNIAVLVRKRAQILKVIDAFLKAGVPYATDGEEDIRQEKRVRQMLDVLELANTDPENNERKSLELYKILTSDYIDADHSDILKLIDAVNVKKLVAKRGNSKTLSGHSLFEEFSSRFMIFNEKDKDGFYLMPTEDDASNLQTAKDLRLKKAHALHRAAWALNRLLTDSGTRPVHDVIMQYINDINLYGFITKRYEKDKVVKIRDLRALVSFVNMIKQSDLSSPGMRLENFAEELDIRERFDMPLKGQLATLSQDGVRIYTAHKAKGLEFYAVFVPFCLQYKSWPLRGKPDVVPLPPDIYKSKERVDEKDKIKLLKEYDERRLFYVASTRAKSHLIYTAAPQGKLIVSPFVNQLNLDQESGDAANEEEFLVNFIKKTEVKDTFEGTNHILKDLIENITLNPTSLNNYIACKRKFLYDNVLMLPGRKTQNLIFGNSAHKALEEVYTVFMETKKFPDFKFFEKAFTLEMEYQGVNTSIRTGCLSKLTELKAWYNTEKASLIMPLELENKIEITLPGGIVFRGTFDKIEKEDADSIRVIDYKTGKPDKHVKAIANCRELSEYACDDYFRQLVAYKMLYERNSKKNGGKFTVTKGVLQFLEPVSKTVLKYDLEQGKYRNEIVDLTNDMVKDLEKVITDSWKGIQELNFERLPEKDDKERCKWCVYSSICWGD